MNYSVPLITVCIPAYEMHGVGHIYLKNNFDILANQTFKNFDIVISDNSQSNIIKNVCDEYKNRLKINYYKNHDISRGMSTNVNTSIKNANGKIIKLLFLDDFLKDKKSLEYIAKNFNLKKDRWLLTAYEHTKDGKIFYNANIPKYNDQIYKGKNTIGSPSILTIKNESPLFFDVRLKWYMDCDYYTRCFEKFGKPKILNEVTTIIRTHPLQVTNTEITKQLEKQEHKYMLQKHTKDHKRKLDLRNVTLVAVSGINPEGTIEPLELSMEGVDYYDVVLISHTKPENLNEKITFRKCLPTELASTDPKNKDDYSKFMAYELCHYIDSDYALIVHKNAFVIRPKKWMNEFLKYDYVGAPWQPNVHFTKEGVNVRVGNGGFSLRSNRLLNILNRLKLPFTDAGTGYFNEDGILCVYYRKKLEQNGIKYAPAKLAARFSYEKECPESDRIPFGFHDDKSVIPKLFFLRRSLKRMFRYGFWK